MNANEVLKLIDAGYTKAEIDEMLAPTPEQEELPIEIVKSEDAAPQETTPLVDDKTEKRLDKIENILEQLAANGIAGSEAPAPKPKRNVVAEVLEHL